MQYNINTVLQVVLHPYPDPVASPKPKQKIPLAPVSSESKSTLLHQNYTADSGHTPIIQQSPIIAIELCSVNTVRNCRALRGGCGLRLRYEPVPVPVQHNKMEHHTRTRATVL